MLTLSHTHLSARGGRRRETEGPPGEIADQGFSHADHRLAETAPRAPLSGGFAVWHDERVLRRDDLQQGSRKWVRIATCGDASGWGSPLRLGERGVSSFPWSLTTQSRLCETIGGAMFANGASAGTSIFVHALIATHRCTPLRALARICVAVQALRGIARTGIRGS